MSRAEPSADVPPVPQGWERVRPNRPLLAKVAEGKRSLQWCPVCGPAQQFAVGENGVSSPSITGHLQTEHGPADFGLSPLSADHEGPSSIDAFGGGQA